MKGGKKEEPKEEKKKVRIPPFTAKEFIATEYGLPLLQRFEEVFQLDPADRGTGSPSPGTASPPNYFKYMEKLARLYIGWIQSSPLCGNKRTRAYHILKAVQQAVKTQQGQSLGKENSSEPPEPTLARAQAPRKKAREVATYDRNSLFEESTLNTQSFSLLTDSLADLDTVGSHCLKDFFESSDDG
ncbi:hypothetical protein NEDG_00019 [Nematocida displodere]|uniref:Uncharacterized protein n=1 Tax=Nematocida displodere TaxID=1805483 RepID=A0A177EHT8_9MICR|nr:hypothetical protein NEDG_00019 [Nematocida displodere]